MLDGQWRGEEDRRGKTKPAGPERSDETEARWQRTLWQAEESDLDPVVPGEMNLGAESG